MIKMNEMKKELLKEAVNLEKNANAEKKWRPKFHISPITGWLNDPNGLCEFNGEYHIFFQYSPYDVVPGKNFWGHYKTADFVNYTYMKPALACDKDFDKSGVYSGSALVENNNITLFYTGNVKHPGDYDYVNFGREHNTISVTSRDGVHFENKTVLLRNSDYPDNLTLHVRDPKVYKTENGYVMFLGARTKADIGEVISYKSTDKLNWKLDKIYETKEKFGYMWECPDCVTLNDKTFLLISPQGIEEQGYRFNNVYQSGYFKINSGEEHKIDGNTFEELDCGFDFYAPQTFKDSNDRTILIGWMGLPDVEEYYTNPTVQFGWMHMLTMPRELYEKDGKICQRPLDEFKSLRKDVTAFTGDEFSFNTTAFEAEIKLNGSKNFSLVIDEDAQIIYNDNKLSLKFKKYGYGRNSRTTEIENLSDLHLFVDNSSIELFANDGSNVFTSRFYPDSEMFSIKALSENMNINIYKLSSFNFNK